MAKPEYNAYVCMYVCMYVWAESANPVSRVIVKDNKKRDTATGQFCPVVFLRNRLLFKQNDMENGNGGFYEKR